jgi:hypothetical protein
MKLAAKWKTEGRCKSQELESAMMKEANGLDELAFVSGSFLVI